ncbi:phage tail length tape measure family protein [Rhizobium alvei]|uniref:Phage tail length tape measure family protein n=1 Tax=Rhizobium alvei TaxID=1132659 RepID=A0ABT8YU43_9HYPH|nr:phage tail length tape measure family protein [Rhizobium alvei]MDO6967020.1 phage tail length tape measure family protein [Rhizobium alvei]
MTQAMKLSILIGADASGAKAGGAEAERAIDKVGQTAQKTARSIQAMIEAETGVRNIGANSNLRADDLAAYGAQMDALRARYNPLFAAVQRYRTEVAAIRDAHKIGAISASEMTAAMERERAAANASIAAIRGRNAAVAAMPGQAVSGAQGFQTANIAAQFQDIGVSAAMGMSPLQIALQQGTQLSAVFASMDSPIKGIGAALTSLISPMSLLTIGSIALGTAAAQWFASGEEGVDNFEAALDKHRATLDALKATYGELARSANFGPSDSFSDASLRNSLTSLSSAMREQYAAMFAAVAEGATDATNGTTGDLGALARAAETNKVFADSIRYLLDTAAAGAADLDGFNAKIDEAVTTSLKMAGASGDVHAFAEQLRAMAEDALQVGSGFEAFSGPINKLRAQIATGIKPDLAAFQAEVEKLGQQSGFQRQADQVILLGDKLVDLANKYRELETIQNRVAGGDHAAQLKAMSDGIGNMVTANDKANLDKIYNDLLGSTLGRTEAGVREIERVYRDARLRIENESPTVINSDGQLTVPAVPASRPNSLDYDPNEELNKKLEQERKRAADELEREIKKQQDYLKTQSDSIGRLELEISLVGKSADERARAIAAYEAEIKIRELGLATMSKEAEQLRTNAAQMANLKLELERQQGAWSTVQNAGSSAIDSLVVGTGSLKDSLKSVTSTLLTTFQQLAFANPLKNNLLGTNLPTLGDLFAGKSASPLSTTSTAAMTVTAGTVMINGSPLGLPGLGTTSLFGNAANTNIAAATTGNMAMYQQAIAAIESGGNYGALGPWTNGDRAYGKYQVMGNNIGPWTEQALGQRMTPDQFLANPAAQDAVFNQQFSASMAKYGTPQDAASVWFTGRPQAQGANSADVLGTTGRQYVDKFNGQLAKLSTTSTNAAANVDKMASSSVDASKALTDGSGSLLSSINKTSQALPAQTPAPATTINSTGGLFSGLISGIGGAVSGIGSAISSIFSSIFSNLFADGAAFSSGSVVAFANGGVVDRPTFFPMSRGRTGLMGEAGEEAIMPLARGADGRLGVRNVVPRAVRQSGGEMRMALSTSHTLHIYGTTNEEILRQANEGTRAALEERDRAWVASFPEMIEAWRRDPNARWSG